MFLAACVQLRCNTDIERNLSKTEELVRRAASMGAKLIATPENTSLLGPQFHKVELAESIEGPIASRLSRLAAELGVHPPQPRGVARQLQHRLLLTRLQPEQA